MKIGVISDTHNHLDPAIPALFQGVEHILHAGDIGLPWIIQQLENIAPVTAVLGNTDTGLSYKETELTWLGDWKFLVHHIVNPHSLTPDLKRRVIKDNPDVVLFGHTHKAFWERIGGVLYLNPGYAGQSRFAEPRSVAILHCDDSGIRAEFKPL